MPLSSLFSLETVYGLTGALLLLFSLHTCADRGHPLRWSSALFWGLLAGIFMLGERLPAWVVGIAVLLMVALDGLGLVGRGGMPDISQREKRRWADRLGDQLFLPVLAIPLLTALGGLIALWAEADVNQGSLVGLGFGGVAAMLLAMAVTGAPPSTTLREGWRLNETMGTVNILPQLLASLGSIFVAAGVGTDIAEVISHGLPADNPLVLSLATCLGMALLTIMLGNSFAAFPIIATGVLIPLLIQPFGLDPAMAGIVTLTAGSSGTLMTPMAANFNILPAALLQMRDPYGAIKFQFPYAVVIWSAHVLLLWWLLERSL
jgi:uncharacterized membrane protein